MKASCVGFYILALSGCLAWPGPRVKDSFAVHGFHEDLRLGVLAVESIAVDKELDAEAVRANAEAIVKLLLARYSPEAQADSAGEEARYAARMTIKERSFQKEYENFNSVTLEVEVRKEGYGEPSFIYAASEDTKNTVSSYRYLFRILRRAFQAMYR